MVWYSSILLDLDLPIRYPAVIVITGTSTTDKALRVNKFLFNFGLKIKVSNENIYPKEFSKILDKVKGKQEEKVVSNLILRTLKVARYEAENKGHFGIASKYYCHFTSPIRRYPDLFIHRVISKYLEKNYDITEKFINEYTVKSENDAKQSSEREKIATKVERESQDLKKAEYMEGKIGQVYKGIISSITQFGVFVELENTVEGLIRFENLGNEYFIYDEEKKQLGLFDTKYVESLRSGENIVYDGDIVVMKDMNPGSQLTSIRDIVIMGNISAGARAIAAGNITVMGKIEGFVHAGANGNDRAYIVGNCLCPKVLQIADNIAEAPDDDESNQEIKEISPEIAFVSEGRIVIESYLPKNIKKKEIYRG